MQYSNLFNTVSWTVTLATVAVLAALWINLFLLHSSPTDRPVQVDRNLVLDKNIVDAAGLASAVIVALGVVLRVVRRSSPIMIQEIFHVLKAKKTGNHTGVHGGGRPSSTSASLVAVLRDIFLLGKMGECDDLQQWLGHFLTMWGFIGLGVATTLDAVMNFEAVPLPILHPVRILGNLSGVLFMAGVTLLLVRRLLLEPVRTNSKGYDWLFLLSMYGTGATGFAVQWFADTANQLGTSASYGVHLVFIALLLLYSPWSKFIHALWRPSWIIYARLFSR